MKIVVLGLSITSSWGNGHATTYRALLAALAARGHELTFFERDVPWYADNRDLPEPPFCRARLYHSVEELRELAAAEVRAADVVIVGSYVPDGVAVGEWVTATARGVTAFYDIDTPVTARALEAGSCAYLTPALVGRYDLYLSFTGGPLLDRLRDRFSARRPRPLYCAVDPTLHKPMPSTPRWDLGYLGTYAPDRQPALERLLVEPARKWPDGRFAVAGPQYPDSIVWPSNVDRVVHVSPSEHPSFFGAQRVTLNLTRADMAQAGWSPSVRLFEAAACGTPIVSDWWPGLDHFFAPGEEILVARSAGEVLQILKRPERVARIGEQARRRVQREHTAAHRAEALERYVAEAQDAAGQRTRRKERTSPWPESL